MNNKKICLIALIFFLFGQTLPTVAADKHTKREIFSNQTFYNCDIGSNLSINGVMQPLYKDNNVNRKALMVKVADYKNATEILFKDGAISILPNDLVAFKSFVISAKVKIALISKEPTYGINVYMPVKEYVQIADYPSAGKGNWKQVALKGSDFNELGRAFDENRAIGIPDPSCKDESYRLTKGDFNNVIGIAFLADNTNSNPGYTLGTYNVTIDDLRIMPNSEPFTTISVKPKDIFMQETTASDVVLNPIIDFSFNTFVDETSFLTDNVTLSDKNIKCKIKKDGNEYQLTFDQELAYDTQYVLSFQNMRNTVGEVDSNIFEYKFKTRVQPTMELFPPQNLRVTDTTKNSVKIEWDSVTNSDKYYVYRDNAKISETTDTMFVDTNVVADTSYNYKVIAVNSNEKIYSIFSSPVVATTQSFESPTGLSVKAGFTSNLISWNYDVEADSYRIYRDDKPLSTVLGSVNIFYDDTVTQNQSYNYKITSLIGTMESKKSEPVACKTQAQENTRILFENGVFKDGEGGGWNGAGITISQTSAPSLKPVAKVSVPAYAGAEITIKDSLKIESANRGVYSLEFDIKGNEDSSGFGDFYVGILDSQKVENTAITSINSGKWKHYSIPMDQFLNIGVKYEGGYKKRTFDWNSIKYIAFYAIDSNIEAYVDNVKIVKNEPVSNSVNFYDNSGEMQILPNKNTSKIEIVSSLPLSTANINKLALMKGKTVVSSKFSLSDGGYKLIISDFNLDFEETYTLSLSQLKSQKNIGLFDKTTVPPSDLEDEKYAELVKKIKFDTKNLSGNKSFEKKPIEFTTQKAPLKISNIQLTDKNGDILLDGKLQGNTIKGIFDIQNQSMEEQKITALLNVYKKDGDILKRVGTCVYSGKINAGESTIGATTATIEILNGDLSDCFAQLTFWYDLQNIVSINLNNKECFCYE